MNDPAEKRLERQRRHVRSLIEQGRSGEARMVRGMYAFTAEPMELPPHIIEELEPVRQEFLRKLADKS